MDNNEIITSDNIILKIGEYCYYVGGSITCPIPEKRQVTRYWLHGKPFKSYGKIFSSYYACQDYIKTLTNIK